MLALLLSEAHDIDSVLPIAFPLVGGSNVTVECVCC